jgi:hypothetical protein
MMRSLAELIRCICLRLVCFVSVLFGPILWAPRRSSHVRYAALVLLLFKCFPHPSNLSVFMLLCFSRRFCLGPFGSILSDAPRFPHVRYALLVPISVHSLSKCFQLVSAHALSSSVHDLPRTFRAQTFSKAYAMLPRNRNVLDVYKRFLSRGLTRNKFPLVMSTPSAMITPGPQQQPTPMSNSSRLQHQPAPLTSRLMMLLIVLPIFLVDLRILVTKPIDVTTVMHSDAGIRTLKII